MGEKRSNIIGNMNIEYRYRVIRYIYEKNFRRFQFTFCCCDMIVMNIYLLRGYVKSISLI